MTDDEIVTKIGIFMGWKWYHLPGIRNMFMKADTWQLERGLVEGRDESLVSNDYLSFPDYLNDLNAVAGVETELESAGLTEKYTECLVDLISTKDNDGEIISIDYWTLLHASARQRCEAIVKVI